VTKNVLVIGSGGREHALAWALSRSEQVRQIFVAPGNGGTTWTENPGVTGLQPRAPSQNVSIAAEDIPALVQFAQEQAIDLTVAGPEVPLTAGIVDVFQQAGLVIFGPTQAGAQLEASKSFAKDFMRANGIPTADYGVFADYDSAHDFLRAFGKPAVIKANGLAAGKGVLICDSLAEAESALRQVLVDRVFGDAGNYVVIERRLYGREFSLLAFADGKTVAPMLVARDHKRALDGDKGLNTGGMGAFAPTPELTPEQIKTICQEVLQPAIDGLSARGIRYVGVLYAGLMFTNDGMSVLEFNCRFGDPETQVILPLLKTDLFTVMQACVEGRLAEIDLRWHSGACATVVIASPGYPQEYPKGLPISGLESLQDDNVIVFHAGTKRQNNQLVTSGGRVLAVTAVGDDLTLALRRVYTAVSAIHFDGMHYRRDIGKTE